MKFIRKWAYGIAYNLQESRGENHHMRYVYYYGYQAFFSQLLDLFCILLAGLILKTFLSIIIISTVFAIMRFTIGGYHMKTFNACFIITLLLFVGSSIIVKYTCHLFHLNTLMVTNIMLYIFSVIVIIKYAPIDSEAKPIADDKKPKYKKMGVMLITALFIINIILLLADGNEMLVLSVNLGILLEVLSVAPFGYKLYEKLENKINYKYK